MILVSLYGSPRADDKTLSRASGVDSYSISSVWLLIGIAVLESFVAWSMYEWGELHFELDAIVACSRNFFDYFMEDISELAQILISISLVWLLLRYSKTRIGITSAKVFYELFRQKGLNYRIRNYIKNVSIFMFAMISSCNQKFFDILQKSLLKSLGEAHLILSRRHIESISSHIGWIIAGVVMNFIAIFMCWK
jgi:hypothetical protein